METDGTATKNLGIYLPFFSSERFTRMEFNHFTNRNFAIFALAESVFMAAETVTPNAPATSAIFARASWTAATRRRFQRRDMSRRNKARTCPRTPNPGRAVSSQRDNRKLARH